MRHLFLITACLAWVLAHGARMLVAPVLPLVEDEFGLSHGEAGRMFLFLTSGYILSLFTTPFWSRYVGFRRMLLAAVAVLAATLIGVRWTASVAGIQAAIFAIGLTTGAFIPCIIPLLSAAYGKELWGRYFAIFESSSSAGQLLAPVIAVLVLPVLSWRYVYWPMAALAIAVLALAAGFAPRAEPAADHPRGSIRAVVGNPNFLILAWLWMVATSGAAGLGFLIPVYLVKERTMELSAANQVFAAGRALGVAVTIAMGVLADRGPCRVLLGRILVLTGLGQLAVAHWPGNVGAGVFVVLEGGIALSFFAVGLVLIARLSTLGALGAALGWVIGIGTSVGFGVTPWVLGNVADAWSFRAGITGLGVLTLASSLLVLRLERV